MARALYIHWPFCLKKCPYCDFNSHVRAEIDQAAWEAAMLSDLRHEAEIAGNETLTSIFFGGGTPSLMPPALVERLLVEARELWGFADGIEITLEANPSSVEAANFAALAEAGINRVSLGLQSFDDEVLRFLGRLHSASEGRAALEIAQRHFERVSFDLIYALPGQTAKAWETMLDRALALETDHLSLYQLTIEPNTRFATDVRRGVFAPLEDDPAAKLFAITQQMTSAAGLPRYEISNHARPGEESRHNLTYWRYADYCGIGPGAHGRRRGAASLRHKKPENWLSAVGKHGHGIREDRPLNAREQVSEALMMGLRLTEGVSQEAIATRFGMNPDHLFDHGKLELLTELGFIRCNDEGWIKVTDKGMPLLDAVLGEIVSAGLVTA